MARFFVTFVALMVAMFAIELQPAVQRSLVIPWTELLASVSSGLVTSFDADVAARGKVLWNPATGFGVSIEAGCNGVEACIILVAGMLAFPASWRHRLLGIAIGLVAVQGLNVVRVISLFYIGQWNLVAFKVAHEYLWQGLIMLDVLVVWMLWARAAGRDAKRGTRAGVGAAA